MRCLNVSQIASMFVYRIWVPVRAYTISRVHKVHCPVKD